MFASRTIHRKITQLSSVLVVAMLPVAAFAQQLGVTNNSVTVSNQGGSFSSQALSIDGSGNVASVSGIPSSGALDIPTFAFDMVNNGVANATYTFTAGFAIDHSSSDRRLEISIPGISLTVNGNTLNGTISNPNNVTLKARNADGTITASKTNVAVSGTMSISDSTFRFDADDMLAEIVAEGGIFADIINTIDVTGQTYNYVFVLKQTPAVNIQFGINPGASFDAFDTSTADFILDSNALQATFTGGYKLAGALTFGTASSGGGGTGGTNTGGEAAVNENTEQTTETTNNINNSITAGTATTEEVNNQLDSLADQTLAAAGALANTIDAGDSGTDEEFNAIVEIQVTNLLSNITKVLNTSKTASDSGIALNVSTTTKNLNAVKDILAGVKDSGRALTGESRRALRTSTIATFSSLGNLLASLRTRISSLSVAQLKDFSAITASTAITDFSSLVDNAQAITDELLAINGIDPDAELITNFRGISAEAAKGVYAAIGTEIGLTVTYSDDATAQSLLNANPALVDRLIDIALIDLGVSNTITTATTQTALETAGLTAGAASSLSTGLANFIKSDDLSVTLVADGTAANASDLLSTAFSASSFSVDATTGAATVVLGGVTYEVFVNLVAPAPALLPTGALALPDGSVILVSNGLVFGLTSAPANMVEFAGAIAGVSGGYTTSVRDNGTVTIDNGTTDLVGRFNYTTTSGTAVTSLAVTPAAGDPASADYLISVQFTDGSKQRFVPAMGDDAFFRSVAATGLNTSVDASTGIITIGSFSFKPSYFVEPLTASDSIFLGANDDASGVAYQTLDANGDGITDYRVLTVNGKQVVYGRP